MQDFEQKKPSSDMIDSATIQERPHTSTIMQKSFIKFLTFLNFTWFAFVFYRAFVVADAEGAAAPFNFEQWVHAPVNFQPFYF